MLLSFGQGSLRRAVLRRPGQQLLPDGSPPRRPLPAASSRWLSTTSLPVCTGVLAGQQLLPDAAAAADLSAGVTPRSGAATFPHRLPLRSIPPAALRLRAPSHSRGEGTEKVSEHSVISQRTIDNYLVVCWIFCIFK